MNKGVGVGESEVLRVFIFARALLRLMWAFRSSGHFKKIEALFDIGAF